MMSATGKPAFTGLMASHRRSLAGTLDRGRVET